MPNQKLTTTDPKLIERIALEPCPNASDGRHQIDTSMESGPHNCFYCEVRLPADYASQQAAWSTRAESSPAPDVVEMDEDWLEEVISDSLDMDWRPRDAARLILSRLGEVALPTAAAINEAVQNVGQWQDIATAPSKRLIDVWVTLNGGYRLAECYYDSICGEWRSTRPSGHLICIKERHVTHWMPLPSPPAIEAHKESQHG